MKRLKAYSVDPPAGIIWGLILLLLLPLLPLPPAAPMDTLLSLLPQRVATVTQHNLPSLPAMAICLLRPELLLSPIRNKWPMVGVAKRCQTRRGSILNVPGAVVAAVIMRQMRLSSPNCLLAIHLEYVKKQSRVQTIAYHLQTADGLPDRRASLAPSTYSTSSASYYSPNPDSSPPLAPLRNDRLPSLTYPSPPSASGSRPAQPSIGLTAAQAYQASQGHQTAESSPASAVFPYRPGASPSAIVGASSISVASFASSSSSGSQAYPSSSNAFQSHSNSRPHPPDRPDNQERLTSPPPDYMRAMDTLGFDGKGGGPLDAVPGIPTRQRNEGDLKGLDRHKADEARQTPAPSIAPSHRRMASDSSFASSAYTAVNNRPHLA